MKRTIHLLGTMEVLEDGVSSPIMKSPKCCALLVYLLLNRKTHNREALAYLFWEEHTRDHSMRNFRALLSRVRKWIPELEITRTTISFPIGSHTDVDFDLLSHALREAVASHDTAVLDEALQLYKGELLGSFYLVDSPMYNEWLELEREQLRQRVRDAYRELCKLHHQKGSLPKGIAAARRWVALDGTDEEAQQWLIRLLMASGDATAAKKQYEYFREFLLNELGIEPEEKTLAILEEVQVVEVIPETSFGPPDLDSLPQPRALPSSTNVPFRRNNDFVGRSEALLTVARHFFSKESVIPPPVAVVTGMKGLGKTQLAVEFAFRYASYFPGGVFWLNFAQPDDIAEKIATIGGEYHLELYTSSERLSLKERVKRVTRVLQEPTLRLLIFDNCDDHEALTRWLPTTGGSRVLLTSNRTNWPRELVSFSLPLPLFQREESVAFLQLFSPQADVSVLDDIASEMGDLPLALHLAGGFLYYNQQLPPSGYLKQLQEDSLLEHPSLRGKSYDFSPTGHDLHIGRAFALNLEQLEPENATDALALRFLDCAACLAPGESIPLTLLFSAVRDEEQCQPSEEMMKDALKRLTALSLLIRQEHEMLALHRLLAAFVRGGVDQSAQKALESTIIGTLPSLNERTHSFYTLPFPSIHLYHMTKMARNRGDTQAATLSTLWGLHLLSHADFDGAFGFFQQALELHQDALGEEHIESGDILRSMGIVFDRKGHFQEAIQHFEQALHLQKGKEKSSIIGAALTFTYLGSTQIKMGLYKEAIESHRSALRLKRKAFGDKHFQTAQSLSSLGAAFGLMGNYKLAEQFIGEALQIQEQLQDADPVYTSRLVNNLGATYYRLGDYNKALELYQRGLRLRRQKMKDNHPHVADVLHNIGMTLLSLGELEEAWGFLNKALTTRKNFFGEKELPAAQSIASLGEWYLRRGDFSSARKFLEEGLELIEASYPSNISCAKPLYALGELCILEGKFEEAGVHLQRSVDIWSKSRKLDVPDYVPILLHFGNLYRALEEEEKALDCYQKGLDILEAFASVHNPLIPLLKEKIDS